MKKEHQGLLAIHTAVFLFGLSGLLGKMIAAPPRMIVFSRALLAALGLGLILLARGPRPRLARREIVFLAGSGAVLAIHWLTFFQAVQVSTVAIGLLSFSSFPLFVTLLEPLVFRERLRSFDVLTVGAVVTGLALVVPGFDFTQRLTQGAVWGTLSGFTFAVLSVLNRKFVQRMSPLSIAAGQNAVAAIVLLPFVREDDWGLGTRDLSLLLALGLFCTGLAHALFIGGLTSVRAQTASIITGLEPVYGTLFALLFLREVPTARTLVGGTIILGATVIASRYSVRFRRVSPVMTAERPGEARPPQKS